MKEFEQKIFKFYLTKFSISIVMNFEWIWMQIFMLQARILFGVVYKWCRRVWLFLYREFFPKVFGTDCKYVLFVFFNNLKSHLSFIWTVHIKCHSIFIPLPTPISSFFVILFPFWNVFWEQVIFNCTQPSVSSTDLPQKLDDYEENMTMSWWYGELPVHAKWMKTEFFKFSK